MAASCEWSAARRRGATPLDMSTSRSSAAAWWARAWRWRWRRHGRRVLLIEAVPPDAARSRASMSAPRRSATAAGASSRPWARGRRMAGAVPRHPGIHVSRRRPFRRRAARGARAAGSAALGLLVPNRVIGAALWQALRGGQRLRCRGRRARAVGRARGRRGAARRRRRRRRRPSTSSARAGGGRRWRAFAGARGRGHRRRGQDYHQVAMVANLRGRAPPSGTAYERFTPHGTAGAAAAAPTVSYTVVWTLAPERCRAAAWTPADDGLRRRAAAALRLARGRIRAAGSARQLSAGAGARAGDDRHAQRCWSAMPRRHCIRWPGRASTSGCVTRRRWPNCSRRPRTRAPPSVLAAYAQRRARADRRGMIGFTDGLVRLFALRASGARHRCAASGCMLFDVLPPAQAGLARVSWGFGAHTPRLLRGLPLGLPASLP